MTPSSVNLLLCPPEYREIVKMRIETFAMFQEKIKRENLTPEQQK